MSERIIQQGADSRPTQRLIVPLRRAGRETVKARSKLDIVIDQAHRDGYEKGLAEGRKAGEAQGYSDGTQKAEAAVKPQLEQQAARLGELLGALTPEVEKFSDELVQQLVGLSIDIARHVIRRELRAAPDQIVAVVKDALNLLPLGEQQVRLVLNPEDAQLVRELLPMPEGDESWRITEDPAMGFGGCRVWAGQVEVDATVGNRLAQVVAAVMGEERRRGGGDDSAEQ